MPRRTLPARLVRRVREAAGDRCGYCRCPQHLVYVPLEVDHIIPIAFGGSDDEANLWLACPICNRHKSDKSAARDRRSGALVPLFNPRTRLWVDHFQWSEYGLLVEGRTAIGRATVVALHLNDDPIALTVRRSWILAGWHPPAE